MLTTASGAQGFPKDDAGGDRYVEGVLGAVLGYFDAGVAAVDDRLLYAFYFVAKYEGVALIGVCFKVAQRDAFIYLFNGYGQVVLRSERIDGVEGAVKIAPADCVFGTQRSFVDFVVGRGGGNATQVYGLEAKSIGRAEHTAYVMETAYVVENGDDAMFGGRFKLFGR